MSKQPKDLLPRILTLPDDESVLRQESDPITLDDDLTGLITRLQLALLGSKVPALGLSAIQIGVPVRVFIALINGKWSPFVNPVIIQTSGQYLSEEEGCLSVPNRKCKVSRWETIEIKPFQFKGGESLLQTFSGLNARIIQHEMDHLQGSLLLDRCEE